MNDNLYDDYNEEHIDEIIPRVLENMEKERIKNMTHREYIEQLSRKQEQLTELSKMWDMLMRQAKEVEVKSQKTLLEFTELLKQAKLLSGDFNPEDIIGGMK